MKTTIKIFCFIFLLLFGTKLQAQSFAKGKTAISAAIGLVSYTDAFLFDYDDRMGYTKRTTGPLYVKIEHAITNRIGIGLNVAYIGINLKYTETLNNYNYYNDPYNNYNPYYSQPSVYENKWDYNNMSFLARINFHFSNSKKIDPYFGAGIGYRHGGWKYSRNLISGPSDDYYDSYYYNDEDPIPYFPLGFETTAGCKFYFTENIGIYGELGIAKSLFQFGLVGKF